jgi:hypothetical protein
MPSTALYARCYANWRELYVNRGTYFRPLLTDSVEKLISQAYAILQANSEVVENPHETRGMAHCAQLWPEIVGNHSPLGSLEFQPF